MAYFEGYMERATRSPQADALVAALGHVEERGYRRWVEG